MSISFDGSAGTISGFTVRPENLLPGFTAANPGTSAYQLMTTYGYGSAGKPGNGWYWIQPANAQCVYTYCDFTTEGGGWTMWRSYNQSYQLNGWYGNDRHQSFNDGFALFDGQLDWKTAIVPKGTYREFLFYTTNTGLFDSQAANNYAVIKPTSATQDFFQGSGSAVAIPWYGKIRGYACGNGGYSGYQTTWYYNNNGYEPHTDCSGLTGAVSSEDNFGYFGSNNTAHYNINQFAVKMVR